MLKVSCKLGSLLEGVRYLFADALRVLVPSKVIWGGDSFSGAQMSTKLCHTHEQEVCKLKGGYRRPEEGQKKNDVLISNSSTQGGARVFRLTESTQIYFYLHRQNKVKRESGDFQEDGTDTCVNKGPVMMGDGDFNGKKKKQKRKEIEGTAIALTERFYER